MLYEVITETLISYRVLGRQGEYVWMESQVVRNNFV